MTLALAIDCPAPFKASLFKSGTVLPLILQANTDCIVAYGRKPYTGDRRILAA